ncbi:MAG TPA: alpha/beta hydrolase, partial [Lysobacter sp.]|nr:alpha/beta hydrolase [Lysobacter sp.]
YQGELLVVRAGRDTVIPSANTQRLIDSLSRPPQVIDLPVADHSNVSLDPAYAKAITAFFAKP